jgi:hypothetical protein
MLHLKKKITGYKISEEKLQKKTTETERVTELSGPNIVVNSDEMQTEPHLNPPTPTIECSM